MVLTTNYIDFTNAVKVVMCITRLVVIELTLDISEANSTTNNSPTIIPNATEIPKMDWDQLQSNHYFDNFSYSILKKVLISSSSFLRPTQYYGTQQADQPNINSTNIDSVVETRFNC